MRRIIIGWLCLAIFTLNLWAAKISSVNGTPIVCKFPDKEWKFAVKGMVVNSNDKIRCDDKSKADLVLNNGHRIKIWPKSEVSLDTIDGLETKINLLAGRLRSWVKKLKVKQKYEIKTPVAVCSVRGTDFSVSLDDNNKVKVEVYEGVVSAREERTGSEVNVKAGEFTEVGANAAPAEPKALPQSEQEESGNMTPQQIAKEETKREIFQEISREQVLAKAADEIKLAEFQNGKACVDASGHRVRMEEYIVRTRPEEFKYVVLNTREVFPLDNNNPGNGHFNFGKIVFTFNDILPADLTLATKDMFTAKGAQEPALHLTDVVSVMSNTVDQVNEEASGGEMFADNQINPHNWNLSFGSYKFYVGTSGNDKLWWEFNDSNSNGMFDSGEISYYNINTSNKISFSRDFTYDSAMGKYYFLENGEKVYFNEFDMPSGNNTFHFFQKNNYSNNQWISTDDYIIDDNGNMVSVDDLQNKTASELKQKAYESNFERVYNCSVFNGRKIDLVFSAKLLIDAGILSLPNPKQSN